MSDLINGKSFDKCTINDIDAILNNSDYRENEHWEYKEKVDYFCVPRNNQKLLDEAKAEFRKDICAMANADGGYIFLGIIEDNGVPCSMPGVDIPDNNTDKYELELRKLLNTVLPMTPDLQMRFLVIENTKYIVIIYIEHSDFAPYIFLENSNNYRVYKRYGNQSTTVSYEEMRNMFNKSMIMEKEIIRFRQERIDFFRTQDNDFYLSYSQFAMVHIIPDSFLSRQSNKSIYRLNHDKDSFRAMFQPFKCSSRALPILDGMRFLDDRSRAECRLFNNLIAEAFVPVRNIYADDMKGPKLEKNVFFDAKGLWFNIYMMLCEYRKKKVSILATKRLYICINIIGCKDMVTDYNRDIDSDLCCIDRNMLLCEPFIIEDIQNDDIFTQRLKELQFEFLLSLSFRLDQEFKNLYKVLYSND